MSLKGENVPVVEGKSASHDRFTVLLSCCSDEPTINRAFPFCELMFKAAEDGPKRRQLSDVYRTCGEKPWFSVTTAPKGTYRETDIVDVLQRQLPRLQSASAPPGGQPRWQIYWADDFSAHKTPNVEHVAWENKFVWMVPHLRRYFDHAAL